MRDKRTNFKCAIIMSTVMHVLFGVERLRGALNEFLTSNNFSKTASSKLKLLNYLRLSFFNFINEGDYYVTIFVFNVHLNTIHL